MILDRVDENKVGGSVFRQGFIQFARCRNFAGDIIICGDTYTEDKNFQSFVQKVSANGDTLWRKIYGDEHQNFSQSILEREDEGYLLYWSEGENEGFTNRKLSMLDDEGEIIWDKTLLDEFQ